MLCYLQLYTELALRAKGILMMRENGFDVPVDEETEAKFAEMRFLEQSIGKAGLLAHPADAAHEPQGPVAALHAGEVSAACGATCVAPPLPRGHQRGTCVGYGATAPRERGAHAYIRSMIAAMPWPPPMHIVMSA